MGSLGRLVVLVAMVLVLGVLAALAPHVLYTPEPTPTVPPIVPPTVLRQNYEAPVSNEATAVLAPDTSATTPVTPIENHTAMPENTGTRDAETKEATGESEPC